MAQNSDKTSMLSDKDKAEMLDFIRKSAIERFKTRLDWEWKARFGLWTALSAATALTLGSSSWQPSENDFCIITIAISCLMIIYGICFCIPVQTLHADDGKLWRACEIEIKNLSGANIQVSEARNRNQTMLGITSPRLRIWFLSVGQFAVTCIFAFAFLFAVHVRAHSPVAPSEQLNLTGECRSTGTVTLKIYKDMAQEHEVGQLSPNTNIMLTGFVGSGIVQISSPEVGWVNAAKLKDNC